jgi:hypothetical protein
MTVISDVVTGLAGPLMGLVDDLFTSDEERAAAKIKLLEMEQRGELQRMKTQMSAILAEANSRDKWTSRARPGFLYVVYLFILASIPMGFLYALHPETAQAVAAGVGDWLAVIPDSMWTLFGAGYLGYTGARSFDKNKGTAT